MLPGRLPLVFSVPLSVGLHTTSQLATLPLTTLQEREMEVAVMELTLTNTCPGAGTRNKDEFSLDKHRVFFSLTQCDFNCGSCITKQVLRCPYDR